MSSWEVISISVDTVNIGHETDSLYANGRMQVAVNVTISANKTGSTTNYKLSPEELKLVMLRNKNTDEKLAGDWTYSDIKNDYYHFISSVSLDGSAVDHMDNQIVASNDKGQTIQFWVSTIEVARMEIVASIQPPGGDRSSSNKSPNDSSVILTGISPITYTADSITIQKEQILQGNYKLEWEDVFQNWQESWPRYWQTNHYVSLKNQISVHKTNIFGLRKPSWEGNGLSNAFGYWASDNRNMRIYYIWEKGPETTKRVGDYISTIIWKNGFHVGRKANAWKDVVVNQNPKALCMTLMYYECEDELWDHQWYDNCGFELYDSYGNYGKLSVTFSHDKIIIND
ncbi:hypothetical protein FAVG1_12150 [Fusarium avenaceum]|nr:hypothetical protein FAVG1_12150 [Fusarium avenaceum]